MNATTAEAGTITVKELDASATGRWDRFVRDAAGATFFHRAGWKRVIERSFGHRCYFLYAEQAGAVAGVLPLVHVKSRLFGNSLISTGFTVGGGPVAADSESLAALDARALALADTLDVDYLEYRGGLAQHPGWAQKSALYVGFKKPIDADPEKNLLAIPRKQRAMVRKGIAAGLVSTLDADPERLYRVYAVSVRNLGTPVFGKGAFRALVETFGPDLDIVTCTRNGLPVSSVMNFYFRDQVLPYFGGGTDEARECAGNDFMYWEVMRRAAERGCRVFDFGRSKVGTGAFAFKKNWGFVPEPLTYEYALRKIAEVPEVNPLNPKYRLFIAAWKRLPLPVANLIGPLLARDLA
jgi:FemAB-related protein (PEP-CTERM system-associated)